jgi:hypothetical protein
MIIHRDQFIFLDPKEHLRLTDDVVTVLKTVLKHKREGLSRALKVATLCGLAISSNFTSSKLQPLPLFVQLFIFQHPLHYYIRIDIQRNSVLNLSKYTQIYSVSVPVIATRARGSCAVVIQRVDSRVREDREI